MRSFLIMLICLTGFVSFAQMRIGTSFRSGFNRIGLYFDPSVNFDFNGHQVDAGIRFYGPDYVFETNVPGASLCYQYNFSTSNLYFAPGISASFFKENKTNATLFLSDILFIHKFGISAGERWSFFSQLGVGAVFNRHNNSFSGATSATSYINYEFALGIKFYLRLPADN